MHRRKYTISKLKDYYCIWEERDQREKLIIDYFQSLFTTAIINESKVVLSNLERKVTRQMNEDLSRHFVEEEVVLALKQMHPSKALGLNGMAPIFFHRH